MEKLEFCKKDKKSRKEYVENALQAKQTEQENKIKNCEFEQIPTHVFGVQRRIFTECYKRGEGRYERAYAADVYTEQKLTVVSREIGEQYGGRNVAYKLAGERRKEHRIYVHQI